MLKKILGNKIVLICCGVLIVGIVIFLVASRDSKVHQQEDHQTEQDNTGLEIKEYVDGTVDSVDGSGSWDDTSDNKDQNTEVTPGNKDQDTEVTPGNDDQKTEVTPGNKDQDTEVTPDDKDPETDDDPDVEDKKENILEDDKEWSHIS